MSIQKSSFEEKRHIEQIKNPYFDENDVKLYERGKIMFIERLNYQIEKKGITRNKFLQELNLAKNSFINWENRGNTPSGETLIKIANYFNVSVDYLLGNDTQTTDAESELNEYLEELKNRSEMRMLFSLAKGATKEDVERAVAIIEALRKKENE